MAFDKRKVIAKAFITQLPLYVTYNHLIVHADYVQKKIASNRIYLKRFSYTTLAIVSTIIKHFFKT